MENVEGRVVLDVLRHVLTACNLASFSLVDCCQSLLGRRLEVLPASAVAHLASCKKSSPQSGFPFDGFFPQGDGYFSILLSGIQQWSPVIKVSD